MIKESKVQISNLNELDKNINEVAELILETQKNSVLGDIIKITGYTSNLYVKKIISPIEMKKLKTEFVTISKNKGLKSKLEMGNMFIEFINITNNE